MKYLSQSFLMLLLVITACKNTKQNDVKLASKEVEQPSFTSKFKIEILDDEALKILDPNSKIEVLASGFSWTEGPLWVEKGNFLLFTDIPKNKVYKLDSKNNTVTYLHPAGLSPKDYTGKESGANGLLLNSKGELVLMQQGARQVGVMNADILEPKESYNTIVDNYDGKRLNSPNDGVFDSQGNLYFTDPPYGLKGRLESPEKELDFQGVYCYLTSGELILLDKELKFPNGIALSNDEKSLYVAVSNSKKASWYKYDIPSPGVVKNKRLFYDVTDLVGKENQQGLPDGLKVNKNEIVFATGPGGVWVFNADGKVLARIYTGQKTANCALNTKENKLYMTAHHYILSLDLK